MFSPCEKTTPKLLKNYSVSEWKEGWGERWLGGIGGWTGKKGTGDCGVGGETRRPGGTREGGGYDGAGGRGMGDKGARVFEVPNPMYLTTAGCVCLIHCVETNEQTNDTNV
jgi:hypothetical protein